jgi:RimJ/RimL family protein N-acetyltransferase
MRISPPERLDDGRAALRPLRVGDAGPYARAFVEDDALGRLLGIDKDPDEASVRERIERQAEPSEDATFFRLAIADPASDAFWGEVIAHSLDDQHRRGEIGFWVVPDQRGRGVGSSAVALAISWMFEELGLLRVEMTTTPENLVVPELARRLGFRQEGILRARNIERGERVDIVWFGLLREEWAES